MALSGKVTAASVSLLAMGRAIRSLAEDAAVSLRRVDDGLVDVARSWYGPAPSAFATRAAATTAAVAPWPYALDGAAATLERWAAVAEDLAADARRAERRLADAHHADPVERDVNVRAARSAIDQVAEHWATTSHHHRLALDGPVAALASIARRSSIALGSRERAVTIALGVDALDMDLAFVDGDGTLQRELTGVLDDIMMSPTGPLVFSVLETARARDLFTADGDLSNDDLGAIDETWAREAIAVWQAATGNDLLDDAADDLAAMVPTVAALMRADGNRANADDRAAYAGEPDLEAVLTDAAVAAFTRAPRFASDRPDTGDAIEAFMGYGAGDIDTLPDLPTASELGYHHHGPPSIDNSFQTTDVFRHAVFDWEQVWGDNRSWLGGGFEVIMAMPFGKLGRVAKVVKQVDLIGDAGDAKRLLDGGLEVHEAAGGHVLARHVGWTIQDLERRQLRVASTFPDVSTAERAVGTALDADHRAIELWLSAANTVDDLEVDVVFRTPIGTVLERGVTEARPGYDLRVVLRRNGEMPRGYHVHTVRIS